MSLADEHLGEAADGLRAAAMIADPYMRADAIWEAALRVESGGAHLQGRAAAVCDEIVRRLVDSCDGSDEPPAGAILIGYARTLDGISAR